MARCKRQGGGDTNAARQTRQGVGKRNKIGLMHFGGEMKTIRLMIFGGVGGETNKSSQDVGGETNKVRRGFGGRKSK